jgi:hypothetical protein
MNAASKKFRTRYVTTDLHLESKMDLTPLAEAFDRKGLIVYHVMKWESGLWQSRFRTSKGYILPDKNIVRMLNAVESLNKTSRSLWEACTVRNFDIAYDCGEEPGQFIQRLSSTTIQRIAQVGAAVVLTLYSPINENFIYCDLAPKEN